MTSTNTLPLPVGLRVADLIAKTARVSLKDTLRVLAVVDAVAYHFDAGPLDVIEACTFDANRPTTDNITACERTFFDMKTNAKTDADVKRLLALSRSLE